MISFELPLVVELEVVDTPPVVKGATATNQLKEAALETGAKIRVPPFIGKGTVVRVDTRTGEYLERAK
jgi:elongation factor P